MAKVNVGLERKIKLLEIRYFAQKKSRKQPVHQFVWKSGRQFSAEMQGSFLTSSVKQFSLVHRGILSERQVIEPQNCLGGKGRYFMKINNKGFSKYQILLFERRKMFQHSNIILALFLQNHRIHSWAPACSGILVCADFPCFLLQQHHQMMK